MSCTNPAQPRNAERTRARILAAAADRFARDGYEQVGVRDIAADAGVDAALVCRYFGSKEDLFAQVVAGAGRDPMEILAGGRAGFGERAARALLRPDGDSAAKGMDFIKLAIRSAASPTARRLVRQRLDEVFMTPFAAWAGGEDGRARARLVASVLMGAAVVRGVLSDSAEPEAERDDAVARLAGVLQSIVDAPEGMGPVSPRG